MLLFNIVGTPGCLTESIPCTYVLQVCFFVLLQFASASNFCSGGVLVSLHSAAIRVRLNAGRFRSNRGFVGQAVRSRCFRP